jgi:hypothetical protein
VPAHGFSRVGARIPQNENDAGKPMTWVLQERRERTHPARNDRSRCHDEIRSMMCPRDGEGNSRDRLLRVAGDVVPGRKRLRFEEILRGDLRDD